MRPKAKSAFAGACWRLLTNREISTLAEAIELIDWYRARWEIEIYFHVLKNGCRVEALQCSAINAIDASALESLEAVAHRLRDAGIQFHLSEVKGPVMDRLQPTHLLRDLSGRVFLTHFQAVAALTPEVIAQPASGATRGAVLD